MTHWADMAGIVFVCVTANHLGLVSAMERATGFSIPVVGCVKCLSFWSVLTYALCTSHGVIASLAISFASSYVAMWLELLEAYIDTIYMIMYGKITESTDSDKVAADTPTGDSESTMPELREDTT